MVAAGLVSEGATAKEFTDEACWWEGFVGDGGYVFEEFEQTVGFAVFFTVLGHELKERFGLLLDDGEFEEHCCVKHHISILLIGKYPLIFTVTYRGPSVYSVLCVDSSVFVIANDTAQKAVICCGYVIMVVEQDGCQRRYIYFELLFCRYL